VYPVNNLIAGDINLCRDMIWAKELIECGFDKSSIFVVGDPYFDSLFTEIQNSKKLETTNQKTRILFCTSTLSGHGFCSKKEENELIINTVNNILKYNDFEISLKIHPSTVSREDYEKEVLSEFSSNVILYQQEDLVELINSHDLMLTYGGPGTIHYGVLMKKPIVNLDFNTNATKNNIFFDEKIITQCKSLSNLGSDIRESRKKVISDEDVQRYIKRYIGIFDGKSSERAAQSILDLLSKKGILP
jgi:UDP-N-acetylglucosamine 2-epimerase